MYMREYLILVLIVLVMLGVIGALFISVDQGPPNSTQSKASALEVSTEGEMPSHHVHATASGVQSNSTPESNMNAATDEAIRNDPAALAITPITPDSSIVNDVIDSSLDEAVVALPINTDRVVENVQNIDNGADDPDEQEKSIMLTAIDEASVMYSPDALPIIEPMLYSNDREIRQAAADALIVLGETAGAEILRKAASQTKDPVEAVGLIEKADYLELPSASLIFNNPE